MNKNIREEFEKEMKMKSTISYGGPEIIGRFEGQYTLWLESRFTAEQERFAVADKALYDEEEEHKETRAQLAKCKAQIEAMKCCGNCANNLISEKTKTICYPCRRFVMEGHDAQYDNWQPKERTP
jgi:hypothetical protein